MEDINQLEEFEALERQAVGVESEVMPETHGLPVEEAAPEVPETSEILYPIINTAFKAIAPNWGVAEEESKALAEAYGGLIDKYFPDSQMAFGAEITALTVTAMVIAPRLNKPRKAEEKEVNPKKDTVPGQKTDNSLFTATPEEIRLD